MKQLLCICLFIGGFIVNNKAQNAIETSFIRGKVINETHQPIEFANIALLTPDSTFLQGTCSNSDGRFDIRPVAPGKYLLQLSYVGYKSICQACTQGETGDWILHSESITLNETTITARRPIFKLKAGKLETNIQHSLLASLNNATDILKHIPGIRSSDKTYTVFGKGTPIIYIDNRQVQDHSELERLAAADIEKVELITNPGVEYDATVKAVIRIRTLQGKKDSIGADLRIGTSFGKRNGHFEQANINYQKQGLILLGMLHYRFNNYQRTQDVQYEIPSTTQWVVNSHSLLKNKGGIAGGRTSLNYEFNSKHSVGASYEYFRNPEFHNDGTSNYIVHADGVLNDETDYRSKNLQQSTRHQLNAYYQGNIKKFQINATADLVRSNSREHQESVEDSRTEGERAISSFTRARSYLYAAKLMLMHPIGEGTLKAGADHTFIRRYDRFNNLQQILPTINSRIDESKIAGFAEYSLTAGKVSLTAGLRFEHAISDYWEKGKYVPEQSRTYNDWCPNFSIDFPIGKTQASLSYTTKTNRPSFFQLRSTLSYNNRFIYEAGNPLLTPETDHTLELTTLYRWFQFHINYQYRKDAIAFMTRKYEENPDAVIFTVDNFRKMQYLNASIHLSPNIKIWKPELGIYFTQPIFEITNQGINKSMNRSSVYLTWNNSIKLPHNIVLSLDMDYQSSGNFGAMLQRSYWGMNMGIRKTFFNKKLTAAMQANDLWNTATSSFMLFGPRLTYNKCVKPELREVSITLIYRFNSDNKFYKGKSVSDKDIQRL